MLISSDAVFRATPPGPLDENAPIQPQGVYAVAKAALEQIAHTLHAEHDRDVLAIRLGGIYGPGERARASRPRTSQIARMVEQALGAARITVDPSAPARAWTFAPDIGAAVRSLLDRPVLAHALYHVASEELLTPQAAAAAICAQLPEQNVTIQAAPGGQLHDPRRHYLSSRRLRDEIGFEAWTPFAHGIAVTLDWQRARREAAL
jgi:nucleoside-diphosphate-sugar epimerase